MNDKDTTSLSQHVIDIDSLLKPCPGNDPAGMDIRYETVYDEIIELRRSEEDLPFDDWVRSDVKKADWKAVLELTQEILIRESKDLKVALWLWEALARHYGFAGLRDGCVVVTRLMEEYWQGLYPRIEDGDLEERIGLIVWIARVLSEWLHLAPLFDIGDKVVALGDWQQAQSHERSGYREELIRDGKLDLESIKIGLSRIASNQLERQDADLVDAREAMKQFDHAVDKLFKDNAPSLIGLFSTIDECALILQQAVLLKGGNGAVGITVMADLGVELVRKGADPAGALLCPADREDALQRLEYLARYFERTEPYSPVPYAIRRAVRWAQMPLEQWLAEIVPDEATLRSVRRALGVDNSGEGK